MGARTAAPAGVLLVLIALLAGCSAANPAPVPPAPPAPAAPAPSPRAAAPAPVIGDPAGAVASAGAAARRHPGVRVGLAIMPTDGGPVTLGPGGDTRFETASIAKLYTIVDILHRAEIGTGTVDAQDADDIRLALTASDDGSMDSLWSRHGGTRTITEVADLVGLPGTAPPRDADHWELTTTTPRDVVTLWHYALTALSPPHRAMIAEATSSSTANGTDGFDQSFGLLAAPRAPGVQAKQGWMPDGDLYLHSTGHPSAASPYLVAVLTRQPARESWDRARAVVDDVTSALTDDLT